jgi:hypothetical protein
MGRSDLPTGKPNAEVLFALAEGRFEIPPVIENSFDEDSGAGNNVAYDLADGRVGSRLYFAFHILRSTTLAISSGSVMLNCCVVLITNSPQF